MPITTLRFTPIIVARSCHSGVRERTVRKSKRTKWRAGMQLSLVHRRESGHRGGTRPGAGRPRKPGAVSHDPREMESRHVPQHVTLRLVEDVPAVARKYLMKLIRPAIRDAQKPSFRIVEFNVLSNHLHLITEAASKNALARGVQGLAVRIARRVNRELKRSGKLFAHRYNARYLRTPLQVRIALRYVLQNRKHHAADKNYSKHWVDPCSSGPWFDGWAEPIRYPSDELRELMKSDRPVVRASVWLLTTGWRKHGLLRFDERPS
jgi:REP element-mobilizing transposase RayT